MFDWQNTGAQNQRFEEGHAHQEQEEEETVDTCPIQCGCIEVAQHFSTLSSITQCLYS